MKTRLSLLALISAMLITAEQTRPAWLSAPARTAGYEASDTTAPVVASTLLYRVAASSAS